MTPLLLLKNLYLLKSLLDCHTSYAGRSTRSQRRYASVRHCDERIEVKRRGNPCYIFHIAYQRKFSHDVDVVSKYT